MAAPKIEVLSMFRADNIGISIPVFRQKCTHTFTVEPTGVNHAIFVQTEKLSTIDIDTRGVNETDYHTIINDLESKDETETLEVSTKSEMTDI